MSADAPAPSQAKVVVLVASAGGLDALSDVLAGLPSDFPAPVVVQQHLGGHVSVLAAILARRSQREVCWAQDGAVLAHAYMPQAAMAAGADVALPLPEIGRVLNDVARGRGCPT